MSKESKTLAAALGYAKRGWRVFPILGITTAGGCECGEGVNCDRAGKHPAIKGWNKEASTNSEKIRAWWTERPDRGVGIATGEESGLTILDVDGEDGVEALTKLAGQDGMPPTPCVQSRPGRYHYYFTYEAGIKSQSGKLGAKLDTRSSGGYVVAPPSRHASGGLYTWLQDPAKVELAGWPAFLREGGSKAGAGKEEKRGRPPKETFNPANPIETERLISALEFCDPDSEEQWSQIGWILGRAFRQSDAGFAKYSAWAARSRKYDAKRTKAHYYERSREIRGSQLKTVATIYAWATEGGWQPSNAEEQEFRDLHVYENPFREETMVAELGVVAAACPGIFAMGMRLIHVVLYGMSGAQDSVIERDPTAYVVWDHDVDTLAVEFGNIGAFWSRTPKGNMVRGGFSRPAVRTFMACKRFTGIKPLVAFVAHPTLRTDGTLITKRGYDPTSRLYLTSEMPGLKVSSNLPVAQARIAMSELMKPFDEYPWASRVDRAVFAASLFTVGLRHLFEVAPLFAFSSPKHGSGKTQLAECVSRLWYGTTLSKATWTPYPEEMEKRIAAFLLAGDRMVCLDNVTEGHRLEDSTLNKVLTSRVNTFRILGRTERVELVNEATWFATGNGIQLSGDIARRALLCYIDANVADPGARRFKIANLPQHIQKHRVALMSAALSIVSSWVASGRPGGAKAHREYGSFTEWYHMMRGLLLWVGEEDIAKAIDSVGEEDTEGAALESFANAFRRTLPPENEARIKTQELIRQFTGSAELRSTFQGCMPHGAEPNFRSVGDLMRRCENKIFNSDNPGREFKITKRRDSNKTWHWGVEYRD